MPCDSTPRTAALRMARPPGSTRADVRERRLHARRRHWARRRRRAAARLPDVDLQTRSRSAFGMRLDRERLADDDAGERRRRRRGAPRLRAPPSSSASAERAAPSGGSASVRSQRSENFIVRSPNRRADSR